MLKLIKRFSVRGNKKAGADAASINGNGRGKDPEQSILEEPSSAVERSQDPSSISLTMPSLKNPDLIARLPRELVIKILSLTDRKTCFLLLQLSRSLFFPASAVVWRDIPKLPRSPIDACALAFAGNFDGSVDRKERILHYLSSVEGFFMKDPADFHTNSVLPLMRRLKGVNGPISVLADWETLKKLHLEKGKVLEFSRHSEMDVSNGGNESSFRSMTEGMGYDDAVSLRFLRAFPKMTKCALDIKEVHTLEDFPQLEELKDLDVFVWRNFHDSEFAVERWKDVCPRLERLKFENGFGFKLAVDGMDKLERLKSFEINGVILEGELPVGLNLERLCIRRSQELGGYQRYLSHLNFLTCLELENIERRLLENILSGIRSAPVLKRISVIQHKSWPAPMGFDEVVTRRFPQPHLPWQRVLSFDKWSSLADVEIRGYLWLDGDFRFFWDQMPVGVRRIDLSECRGGEDFVKIVGEGVKRVNRLREIRVADVWYEHPDGVLVDGIAPGDALDGKLVKAVTGKDVDGWDLVDGWLIKL
ncbi:hypothetical protein HDU97_008984 [Phlyctochytrium planicorne]|nr:hypothetical protein HDU97_008984 [Phlyctochytrium planicorne]